MQPALSSQRIGKIFSLNRFSLLLVFLLSSFFGCAGPESSNIPPGANLNPPDLLALSTEASDLEQRLHLFAQVEVISHGSVVRQQDLEVKWVNKYPDRPSSPRVVQLFPEGGLPISDLKPGDYLYKLHLFHQDENGEKIELTEIESSGKVESKKEALIDFSKSIWRYDFDNDQDGYSNITEIMNGNFIQNPDPKKSDKVWQYQPTDPNDPNSHPNGISILDASRIDSTSPNANGQSKVLGDARSVQSGVLVTVIHRDKDGNEKSRIQVYSRLDGSFEAALDNSIQGDKIEILTASSPAKASDPTFSSSSSPDPNARGVTLTVHYDPVKVTLCIPSGKDFITIEASGVGSSENENEILFLDDEGGEVASEQVLISAPGAKSTTLIAKIPRGAVSGFPIVHAHYGSIDSYGRCPKNYDVAILQQPTSSN